MRKGHGEADLAFERERKFVLPDGGSLPDLQCLGPVSPARTLRLRAEYYDTPAGHLSRAGITLRRRVGGEDDGWHLKTPGPDGSRLEHSLPLGAPRRVPASLRTTVADLVGDQPLLPVLLLRTTRRIAHLFGDNGRIRAEVALDRVRARPLGTLNDGVQVWREVEVELSSSEPSATLDEMAAFLLRSGLTPAAHVSKAAHALQLTAAGEPAPRDTAARAVAAELARHYGRFQALDMGVNSDEDDAVHQARVALRRLRSILSVFARSIDADPSALIRELRWAGALLGAPRDSEVILTLLDELACDVELSPVDDALIRSHLQRRHCDSRALLLNAMATPRWDALHERIVGQLLQFRASRSGQRKAIPELQRLARRADGRVLQRRDIALANPADLMLWHAVRKGAKAARYAHDVVAAQPGAGRSDDEAAAAWKDVSTAFGRVQDLRIAAQELRPLAGESLDALLDHCARQGQIALTDAIAKLHGALPGSAR